MSDTYNNALVTNIINAIKIKVIFIQTIKLSLICNRVSIMISKRQLKTHCEKWLYGLTKLAAAVKK